MNWDNIQITVLHDDGVVVGDEYSYSLKAEQRMIIFGGEPGPQGPQGPEGPQGPPGPSGSGAWGTITGDINDQTDLMNALNAKANTANLGGMAYINDAPSDDKEYVRKNGSWAEVTGGISSVEWGDITGTLGDQTDLQNALDDKADLTIIAADFSTSTSYAVGDYVIYNGALYRFTSAHSAGAWNGSDVTAVTVGSELDAVNDSLELKAPMTSPALTGTPTAPTAAEGTNTTQIATTAFVRGELAKEIMYFPSQACSAVTNAEIFRITNANITSDTVVLECTFAAPANITSNVTWTSYTGYIAFTGTCTAGTTANVTLGQKGN